MANTYIGIYMAQRISSGGRAAMYVVYSLLLAAIAAVWLVKELLDCFKAAAVVDEVRFWASGL